MAYSSLLSMSLELASSAGDITGQLSVTRQPQSVEYMYQVSTTVTGTPSDLVVPIKDFDLNFRNLKLLALKSSAPVDISLTKQGLGGDEVDLWLPIPVRTLHLTIGAEDTIVVSHLKVRLNRSVSTNPVTSALVAVMLGGDIAA